MLLDRTDDEESITLPSSTTRREYTVTIASVVLLIPSVHGYDGIILEVTESSQVVSVMLF